ncbi:hypothetical protein BC834DRAFT_973515 [Gloeopeniophorella convolvens]|nr:hypothetical protein BC834DRAFT_973515 [Gloeopeniophorella convolvens]
MRTITYHQDVTAPPAVDPNPTQSTSRARKPSKKQAQLIEEKLSAEERRAAIAAVVAAKAQNKGKKRRKQPQVNPAAVNPPFTTSTVAPPKKTPIARPLAVAPPPANLGITAQRPTLYEGSSGDDEDGTEGDNNDDDDDDGKDDEDEDNINVQQYYDEEQPELVLYEDQAELDLTTPAQVKRPLEASSNGNEGGRVRQGDYDLVTKCIISVAVSFFRCKLSTRNAWPDPVEESSWAVESWNEACASIRLAAMAPEPPIVQLITSRAAELRGELRNKMIPIIQSAYGFRSGQDRKSLKHNRKLIDELGYVPGPGFIFKGPYRHPAIQKGINMMWFMNRRDEGILYSMYFNPMPYPAIAFILTGIEFCLDKWCRGEKHDSLKFENSYKEVYDTFLKELTIFEETGQAKDKGAKLRKLFHDTGRHHAGAEPLSEGTINCVSLRLSPEEAFIAALDEGSTTESDSDAESVAR